MDDFMHRRCRDIQQPRKCGRGKVHGMEIFFPENFARMDRAHTVSEHNFTSVVVYNFNAFWPISTPDEANAILIIDSDAVLTLSVPL
ncbi:hypothetical protein D3C76_1591270 [compost metagenome]